MLATRAAPSVMFQRIDEEKHGPEDRKLMMVKDGAVVAALAAFGGVIYFFAFLPYKG